ncbi:MAG: TIGR03086 family metal-binding protein [Ilumatobacteraceae bacterium]|nr:TIGR03086 family protein [Acidimicrobiales bacterium]
MSNEVIDRVTTLVQGFDARVHAAPADAWGNAAPCEGWTARDVVIHVGNNLLRLGSALQGTEAREIAADEDIVAAWDEAKSTFTTGITTGDLATTVPGPFGPMPAEQVIGRLVATDVLVHTWDLARAVGGDESLPEDAVAGAYSGLKPMDAMIRQPGVFGPKVEVPAGADLQTEFLAFLGRQV